MKIKGILSIYDYTIIKDFALNAKKQDILLEWVNTTAKKTFIRINDEIRECKFKNKWINYEY